MAQLKMRGNIGLALGALVVGLVVLFVGLYMVNTVATTTDLSTTKFNVSYDGLIKTTGTVISVGGLALIVAGLGMAIKTLVDAFR